MIARLSGTLVEKHPADALLDVQGVGYFVHIPLSAYEQLPPAGQPATLLIHTHVREDAIQLFGFATAREKSLFEMLIGVTGVGPRLALTLLSGLPAEELLRALAAGDARRLTVVPGIGRKTAERLSLELKEKAARLASPAPSPEALAAEDIVSALVNFGYKRPDAERAVEGVRRRGAPAEFAQYLKEALASLTGAA